MIRQVLVKSYYDAKIIRARSVTEFLGLAWMTVCSHHGSVHRLCLWLTHNSLQFGSWRLPLQLHKTPVMNSRRAQIYCIAICFPGQDLWQNLKTQKGRSGCWKSLSSKLIIHTFAKMVTPFGIWYPMIDTHYPVEVWWYGHWAPSKDLHSHRGY